MMGGMGPLPQLYRLLVTGVVVVLGVASGIWLAGWLALPLDGIGVGLAGGLLLAFLATHDFSHSSPRPTRVHRRR